MSYLILHDAIRRKHYQAVRDLFVSSNATDPENTIELGDAASKEQTTIQRLIGEGVIKVSGAKYYFDLVAERDYKRRAKRHNLRVILALAILIAGLLLAINLSQ